MPRSNCRASIPSGRKPGKGFTAAEWDHYLETVTKYGGNITRACELCKVTRPAVYTKRDAEPEFAVRLALAVEEGSNVMMDEARRRAVEGVEEKVYWQGNAIDVKSTYSDALIQFMLRGLKPEIFKDRTSNENINLNVDANKFADLSARLAGKLLGEEPKKK